MSLTLLPHACTELPAVQTRKNKCICDWKCPVASFLWERATEIPGTRSTGYLEWPRPILPGTAGFYEGRGTGVALLLWAGGRTELLGLDFPLRRAHTARGKTGTVPHPELDTGKGSARLRTFWAASGQTVERNYQFSPF